MIDIVETLSNCAERQASPQSDREVRWLEAARRLDWITAPTQAGDWSFQQTDFHIRWFADGVLNVAANCIDRHLAARADQTAILWEPDDPADQPRRISYAQLHEEVCRFANVLKAQGVRRGDTVTIYMPMIPEAAFAMLACARVGAIHSVVFGGFSADALAGRMIDCASRIVITADEGRRGGKRIPLKQVVDRAADLHRDLERVIVVRATGADVAMQPGRDRWYDVEAAGVPGDCPAEPMPAEAPLFLLYTSGSTGKPKGIVHSSGGYLLWASLTHATVFDYAAPEVYWCAADVGWITGHSYIVYGPLANGATTLMFEGVPNWPTPSRMWEVVDRHAVATLYTAPTALRTLMKEGDGFVRATGRSSLRLLGSVGEPIDPDTWWWYHDVVGGGRCPVLDTWWQTETGGHMIAPTTASPAEPGSAGRPLPGIEAALLDDEGRELHDAASGNLVIKGSWPGQMRGIWGDPDRMFDAYFRTFPGVYCTGDGAHRDDEGCFWITGRVDDVINVSGHRLGTAEIESALASHAAVAEAAVVGIRHVVKGQAIYAFVSLNANVTPEKDLIRSLKAWVRREIGPIATPDTVQFAAALPKTRSGKIMRRILRKIAEGDTAALGDTSTLADPAVIDRLVEGREPV